MMGVLAVFAMPVAFFAGGVAFNSWRDGDASMAAKAGAIFVICCLIFYAAPKSQKFIPGDCEIDWDGRSNPATCR